MHQTGPKCKGITLQPLRMTTKRLVALCKSGGKMHSLYPLFWSRLSYNIHHQMQTWLRDAYLRVFEQQGDLIITIKSYLHCWSGTPVRTSVQIRASEGQHLTKQVLEAWRCLGNRHLKAFFVYPTPRKRTKENVDADCSPTGCYG